MSSTPLLFCEYCNVILGCRLKKQQREKRCRAPRGEGRHGWVVDTNTPAYESVFGIWKFFVTKMKAVVHEPAPVSALMFHEKLN
jgi:hypothetical protein